MKTNWQIEKLNNRKNGGDGGEILIISRKLSGNGKIEADGGNGYVGGKGGNVTLISDSNQFTGKVSAKGGTRLDKQKWWEITWIQLKKLRYFK